MFVWGCCFVWWWIGFSLLVECLVVVLLLGWERRYVVLMVLERDEDRCVGFDGNWCYFNLCFCMFLCVCF